MKQLFKYIFILALFLFPFLNSVSAQEIIPSDRRIDWTYAGIPGGIPNRTTICTTINAATYGNGVTDATSAIQTALNNCPNDQVVYLPAGTYKISSKYLNLRSYVTLRGAGPGLTILKAVSPVTDRLVGMLGMIGANYNDSHAIINAVKDSLTLTLDGTAGITAGDYLLLNQDNDGTLVNAHGVDPASGLCTFCGYDINGNTPAGTRTLGQYVVVSAVNGNTVSISTPLHWTYNTNLNPRAYRTASGRAMISAGLENLTLTQDIETVGSLLDMFGAYKSWVKNVEFYHMDIGSIMMRDSFFNQITGCYFHVQVHNTYGQNQGYGLAATQYSSNNLIDNNVAYTTDGGGIEMHGGASGNVIAYNYFGDQHLREPTTWMGSAPTTNHGSHPKMNLYEGNIGPELSGDNIWGSSSHITMFRSLSTGYMDEVHTSKQTAVGVAKNNTYYNFIGNVLGTAGISNRYQVIPGDSYNVDTDNPIYSLGRNVGGSGDDPNVAPSTFRHGNYDYFTNSTIWDPNITNHTLPASLYLSQKPSWWCQETPWPPIGPDVEGLVNAIPAQRRFEGLTCTQGTVPTLTPSPTPFISIPGDANDDGHVTGADYVIWLNHYGQTGQSRSSGDLNSDTFVNGADYVIWIQNYGR